MQLVGATNWFIRWPFVIEGLVVGLFGAAHRGRHTVSRQGDDRRPALRQLRFGRGLRHDRLRAADRRSSSSPRWWSRRSAAASRCAASCAFERPRDSGVRRRPGRSAPCLVAVRGAWRWSRPLGDALLVAIESRTDEALEVIEDSYFRPTDPDELEDASIAGMVREICARNDDRFSHYFDPSHLRAVSRRSTSGRFSGVGLNVREVEARAAGRAGLRRLPRRGGGHQRRRRDRRRRRRVDRRRGRDRRRPPRSRARRGPR